MLVRVEADLQPAWKRWGDLQNAVRWAGEHLVSATPKFADALSAFAAPAAGMMYALALWRVGSDLDWAGNFAIESGLFSHWQVWIALGALTQFAGSALARFARQQSQTE